MSTDPLDQASELAQAEIDSVIADHHLAMQRAKRKRSEDCVVCGEPIPEARQIKTGGTDICVPCKEIEERR